MLGYCHRVPAGPTETLRLAGPKKNAAGNGVRAYNLRRCPMQIVVLGAFMAAILASQEDVLVRTPEASWLTGVAAAVYVAGAAALARLGRGLTVRGLSRPGRWAGRFGGLVTLGSRVWLVIGSAGVVACGYGRWVSDHLGGQSGMWGPLPQAAAKAAMVAPFVAAVLLLWLADYGLVRRLRQLVTDDGDTPPAPFWGRTQYVLHNLRHHLLFIAVPVGLIVVLADVLEFYLAGRIDPQLLAALTLTVAAGVFVMSPMLIVRIWKTRRLPDGPLRRDLERMARELGFAYRDIRLWQSGGVIANAGVMGLARPVRYVLISDALADRLTGRQVQAIFAHEAGHVLGHHIPFMVLFVLVASMSCWLLTAGAVVLLGANEHVAQPAAFAIVTAAGALAFGWISRRFERQCDVVAAWAGACHEDGRIPQTAVALYADALYQVARLNGMNPAQRNWRHGSIRSRICYLQQLAECGRTRQDIDTVVYRIKWALLAAVLLSCTAVAAAAWLEYLA